VKQNYVFLLIILFFSVEKEIFLRLDLDIVVILWQNLLKKIIYVEIKCNFRIEINSNYIIAVPGTKNIK